MTILNRANDGLFNVLISIYMTILKKGPQTRDRLEVMCAPGDISNEKIGQTVNRWTQLGLFAHKEGKYSIHDEFLPTKKKKIDEVLLSLPIYLRTIVFRDNNNENFWDSVGSLSADFTRGIAWLLAQDIYTLPTTSHEAIEKIEIRQFSDVEQRLLQNNTRWNGLKSWAIYLGFAWEGRDLVIDPSKAIQESLPDVFNDKNKMTVPVFLESLSEILPVIDMGKYRVKVEKSLNKQEWIPPHKFDLSMSLSRAVKRLEASGKLRLEYQADTGQAYRLIGQGGKVWQSITHINYSR